MGSAIPSVLASHLGQQLWSGTFSSSSASLSPVKFSPPHFNLFPPRTLPPPWSNTNPCCTPELSLLTPHGLSPLCINAWEHYLHDYPDRTFVVTLLQIISFGASLGFIGDQHPQSCKNLKSAVEHNAFVCSSIEELTLSGHAAGPFPSPPLSNFHCSPLSAVGRRWNPNKLPVINHLSWPHNSSVNDGIPDREAHISYDLFEHAIHDLVSSGRGSLMAKLDLKDAFCHIPVRVANWHLLSFHWGSKFFYLLALAFSIKNTPYIFSLFAEALHWIIQQHIPTALCHYLDKFLLIFPSDTQHSLANAAVKWVMGLGKELGLIFQDSKTVWSCACLEFLGLELDSTMMEAHLPVDKLIFLQDLLHSWLAKQTFTLL